MVWSAAALSSTPPAPVSVEVTLDPSMIDASTALPEGTPRSFSATVPDTPMVLPAPSEPATAMIRGSLLDGSAMLAKSFVRYPAWTAAPLICATTVSPYLSPVTGEVQWVRLVAAEAPMPALPPNEAAPAMASIEMVSVAVSVTSPLLMTWEPSIRAAVTGVTTLIATEPAISAEPSAWLMPPEPPAATAMAKPPCDAVTST